MARTIGWDEPSLTLTCSPAQKQTERCHPDETRPFSVREYARIQTFPDNWAFAGSISQQYKQISSIGNNTFTSSLFFKQILLYLPTVTTSTRIHEENH